MTNINKIGVQTNKKSITNNLYIRKKRKIQIFQFQLQLFLYLKRVN
jgi:hypothetical protein